MLTAEVPSRMQTFDLESAFHPAVAAWFRAAFDAPTRVQVRTWDAFDAAENLLVAAPTGTGKTLAAFLTVIDELIRAGLADGLADGVQVVYVSPLKALGNDVQKNLALPLDGIRAQLRALGLPEVHITTAVRTGDTPQVMRALMRRKPPHVLVTTPESLYILLTSESGRDMLKTTRTVIVDEIHALAGNKRGTHLSLSLERLQALTVSRLKRVGLSATQRPLSEVAKFLIGSSAAPRPSACSVIDEGHVRRRDIALELPSVPLGAVLSTESAQENYDRLAQLVREHRTTLVFVNTRRLAERVAKALSDRLGADAVCSHHGSMSKELRLDAENRLKSGDLRALVATASLELGIDIGDVDLVCQIGTTRSLAAFLQRVGRAGHQVNGIAKGRLFPQTRDELVECAALFDMLRREELDSLKIADGALDVLAQQIVAEVSCRDIALDELEALCRGAYCYRDLTPNAFQAIIRLLGDGYSFAGGKRSAYLHIDGINGIARARKGARLTAVTCGGAIPDNADYDVLLDPTGQFIGTVNEDFAIESLPGDIFQLGNNSWRVLRVEKSAVRVADAEGLPPNIPFWLGEGPARTEEFSHAVARIRTEFVARVTAPVDSPRNRHGVTTWLSEELGLGTAAAEQIYDYLMAGYIALNAMPSQRDIVVERFFDESGGMQLVIHSPFGARINRAWGLALRKRFCRQFNFELQAAAIEDAIVISLGAVHSFPLSDIWKMLNARNVRDILTQALLDAPMFPIRWRWVACCALALPRFRGGQRVAPRLLRMQAEDLVALVFPDQLACAENLHGPREIPEHPLVQQAIHECLTQVMDCTGLEQLLASIEAEHVHLIEKDVTTPSPFCEAILNANPYAFLDDAPLEERRTQAVQSRRWLDVAQVTDIAALDEEAIRRVIAEVWPQPQSQEELHEALLLLGGATASSLVPPIRWLSAAQTVQWDAWITGLVNTRRVVVRTIGATSPLWVAAENSELADVLWPSGMQLPETSARESAVLAVVRGWLEVTGPIALPDLSTRAQLREPEVLHAILTLETMGVALRGSFTGANAEEWCDRRLLARIHKYTINKLRADTSPVTAQLFLKFLQAWHYLLEGSEVTGIDAAARAADLLSGFVAPAEALEKTLLARRVQQYDSGFLDQLSTAGRISWLRLTPKTGKGGGALSKNTPLAIVKRQEVNAWISLSAPGREVDLPQSPSGVAQVVLEFLTHQGPAFFEDIVDSLKLLKTQCEEALSGLAANGFVTSDSFVGLRAFATKAMRKRRSKAGSMRGAVGFNHGPEHAGRWFVIKRSHEESAPGTRQEEHAEKVARALLRRYGVVFRRIIEREACVGNWRDVLRALRRLEARGEIRGGWFVAGFTGEQFALPEALAQLRKTRLAAEPEVCQIAASDPLNLIGILTPGERVAANSSARILFLNGEPVALFDQRQLTPLRELTRAESNVLHAALNRPVIPHFGAREARRPRTFTH